MLVRTDDEVYRIDAVWLGPPRATFPWRARYVSYGVGLVVMMIIMFVQRRLGVPLDFFSVAWALVGTVALTRLLGKKITYERPFGQVVTQFWSEVTGPRARTAGGGGALNAAHVRVRPTRSRPSRPRRRGGRRGDTAAPQATPVAGADRLPARERRAMPVRTVPDEASAWVSGRSRTGAAQASGRRSGRATAKPARTRAKEARRGRA